ncbi:MAG: hypothetical protein NTV97_16355 [Alphaproteobacteria bacterium]|nr:hypothetical protein [Alphaproteobacteria bacterium]
MTFAHDLERPHGLGDTLHGLGSERGENEEIADQPTGRLGDHDAVGRAEAEETGGEVGRFADDVDLARDIVAHDVADHDRSGGDADPRRERSTAGRRQCLHRVDGPEPRPDGAFRGILGRLGIAEIGQHPVAHELGDEAAAVADRGGNDIVIPAHHVAQILGVQRLRQRGGIDEIDEQDRELASFGCDAWFAWKSRRRFCDSVARKGDDGP